MSTIGKGLRIVCTLATAVCICAVGLAAGSRIAAADEVRSLSDVALTWGVNDESGAGAYFGGCNFLSAGTAGDIASVTGTPGAALWPNPDATSSDTSLYATDSGNVRIVKPDADGKLVEPTWSSKCQNRYGTSVNGTTSGMSFKPGEKAAEGTPSQQPTFTQNQVVFSHGSGTAEPSTNSARITWSGSFTIVYYGGLTYWTISDPVLDITDGKGTITAMASGYGTDMDDMTKWVRLNPEPITVAELSDVTVREDGISATPEYLGVSVSDEISGRNPQAAKTDTNAAWWGAFPDSWLQFAVKTGQSSYWYTTDGNTGTIQPRKPAAPIFIDFNGGMPTIGDPVNQGGGEDDDGEEDGDSNDDDGNDDTSNGDDDDSDVPDESTSDGITLRWGINDESNSRAFYGGCNFLSAGTAGNTGKSTLWSTDALYSGTSGNVSIQKPDASGHWTQATWQNKCLTRQGAAVSFATRQDGRSENTESQIVITKGVKTTRPDGSISVTWNGSFTVVFYGGMTYWSVSDPVLTLDAHGNGQLTGTASGYGADMDDSSKWLTLEPTTIVLADLKGVDMSLAEQSHGFTHKPEYLGVAVEVKGGRNPQAAKDSDNQSIWGSFPQSFVEFQVQTGQSSYWYTSNGQRDFAKIALPLSVAFDSSYTVSAGAGSPNQLVADTKAGSESGSASSESASGGEASQSSAALPETGSNDTQASDGNPASAMGENGRLHETALGVAAGSGALAVATGLPMLGAWLVRRRLGLDAGAELDARLGAR